VQKGGSVSLSAMSKDSLHDQRLPKKEVMRSQGDFREVLENGKRRGGIYLQFFFKGGEQRQVGFAVPKRIGRAVLRNRVKRLMREVYRKYRQEIGPYKIVMLAKNEAGAAGFRELEEEFVQFLGKIRMK
jgi:ribonuclease P protein component